MQTSKKIALLLLLIGLTVATPSEATSFYPQAFPTTVGDAPIIVRGRAGRSYSDWGIDSSGNKHLYTFFDLEVVENLKGTTALPTIVMRELGGEKDGQGLHVPGTSTFKPGEDVVVMLRERNSDASYDIQGMMMGKYNVDTDADGNEMITGAGLLNGDVDHFDGTPGQNAPTRKWSLDDLRKVIKDQAQRNPSDLNTSHKKTALAPTPLPGKAPAQSAPSALTPSDNETNGSSPFTGILVAGVILAALALFFTLRRRKK